MIEFIYVCLLGFPLLLLVLYTRSEVKSTRSEVKSTNLHLRRMHEMRPQGRGGRS